MSIIRNSLVLLFPLAAVGGFVQTVSKDQPIPEILNYSSGDRVNASPSNQGGGMAVLEADKDSVLSAQVRSSVSKIHKKMGDDFDKGDVLIELDNKEYSIQFMKAKAFLERNLALYENKKKLYSQNIVSLSEVIEAKANKDSAKADLDQAQLNLENTVILAPYSGSVKKVFLQEGELAKYGSELIEIYNDDLLVANILLPSSYYGKVRRGDKMFITFVESPVPVEAVVERVSYVIDPVSATIKVEASIKNENKRLYSGMSGWALPFKNKEKFHGE